jgi:tetratricopeptide (TPR) repeat protein
MVWLGRLHHARSEYSKAENLLCRALAVLQGQFLHIEIDIRSELTVLYVDSARANEAQPHLARLREIINRGEDWRGLAGHVARAEASVAVAEGRFQEAQGHFEAAVEISRRFQVPWDEAAALHRWGQALVAAGEHQRAVEKFDAAVEIYERHDAGRCWIDRVVSERATAVEAIAVLPTVDPSVEGQCTFRREGEFWTIVWHGKTSRLKDAKGLRYIAYLLTHPGVQIHVHDLITVVEGSAVDTQSHAAAHSDGLEIVRDVGGRGSALDSRARSEYGARLRELRTELDEAERFNDTGRCERLRAEIELVSEELTAGLRRRASSDNAERARGMVSKRIRATLDKIHDEDPALGRHFTTSIKTGYFCAYLPDPDHKIVWQM